MLTGTADLVGCVQPSKTAEAVVYFLIDFFCDSVTIDDSEQIGNIQQPN